MKILETKVKLALNRFPNVNKAVRERRDYSMNIVLASESVGGSECIAEHLKAYNDMRKLFWQMNVTLDGFMEGPNRELEYTA
jgi:hypothetical protein